MEDRALAARSRLSRGEGPFDRGAAEAQSPPPRNRRPGVAHFGGHAGGDFAVAGPPEARLQGRRLDTAGMSLGRLCKRGVEALGSSSRRRRGAAAALRRAARKVEPHLQPHGDSRAARDGEPSPARFARGAAASAGRGDSSAARMWAPAPACPAFRSRSRVPQWQVTLIDSSQKKCAFLRQAVIELELAQRRRSHEGRVEHWLPSAKFDIVISRAFAELAALRRRAAAHLVRPGGVLAAMTGASAAGRALPRSLPCAFRRSMPGAISRCVRRSR